MDSLAARIWDSMPPDQQIALGVSSKLDALACLVT